MPEELALTTQEQAQLLDLLDPDAEIEVIIPQNIDADQLLKTLGLCCRSAMIAHRQHTRSNALIGRMLWVIRERTIHREWGFKSFTQFIEDWVKPRLGKSSSSVYDALLIAQSFPSITPARYDKIGRANLKLLQKFTDETKTDVEQHLARAEVMTKKDLEAWAEERNLISKGEATTVVITITTTREVAHMWRKLKEDAGTIERCETHDAGQILMHLMEVWAGQYGVDLS